MKSIGGQFFDIMKPRIKKDKYKDAAVDAGEKMVEGARERSRNGESLPGGGVWNNTYNKEYARKHNKTPPVNLRQTGRSMKGMRSNPSGDTKASIRGSHKLRKHDKGTAEGGKRRQLFPDNGKQVPKKLATYILKRVKKILTGEGQ